MVSTVSLDVNNVWHSKCGEVKHEAGQAGGHENGHKAEHQDECEGEAGLKVDTAVERFTMVIGAHERRPRNGLRVGEHLFRILGVIFGTVCEGVVREAFDGANDTTVVLPQITTAHLELFGSASQLDGVPTLQFIVAVALVNQWCQCLCTTWLYVLQYRLRLQWQELKKENVQSGLHTKTSTAAGGRCSCGTVVWTKVGWTASLHEKSIVKDYKCHNKEKNKVKIHCLVTKEKSIILRDTCSESISVQK